MAPIYASISMDILIDILSFCDGIELARIKRIHRSFKELVENYPNCFADITIQHLNIVMHRTKYLDKIELIKNSELTMTFTNVEKFTRFMIQHPMPIKLMTLWNTIWISKFLIQLSNMVEIEEVHILQSNESRFFTHTGFGKLVYIGNIRLFHKLSPSLLMSDFVNYNLTSHKTHIQQADGPIRDGRMSMPIALHLMPPNNFECTAIHFDNTLNDLAVYSDVVDWIFKKDYEVSDSKFGRILIFEYFLFDVTRSGMVQSILEKIRSNVPPKPFTLLFKHLPQQRGVHRNNNKFRLPIRRQFSSGGKLFEFLATELHDNVMVMATFSHSSDDILKKNEGKKEDDEKKQWEFEEEEVDEDILPAKFNNQKFSFVIQYKYLQG